MSIVTQSKKILIMTVMLRDLIASFLSNEPYLDTARMLELAEKFASTISLDEINKGLNSWFNHENAWFTIKGPKKESITYPTEKEVSTIIATVDHKPMKYLKKILQQRLYCLKFQKAEKY